MKACSTTPGQVADLIPVKGSFVGSRISVAVVKMRLYTDRVAFNLTGVFMRKGEKKAQLRCLLHKHKDPNSGPQCPSKS